MNHDTKEKIVAYIEALKESGDACIHENCDNYDSYDDGVLEACENILKFIEEVYK